MKELFSFNGRFGRLAYSSRFLTSALFLSLAFVALYILHVTVFTPALYFLVPIGIIFLVYSFAISARRLHDLDLTGWFFLLTFIPLLGLLFWLYMLCKSGDSTSNRYGNPPVTRGWEQFFGWIGFLLFPFIVYIQLKLLL